MLPHDRNGLCRGDVEAWRPIVLPIGSVEVLLDDLLPPRESIATAHEENYDRSRPTQSRRPLRSPLQWHVASRLIPSTLLLSSRQSGSSAR